MLVLRTTGVQSEAHLPFAGLHQLLRPVLGHADELPGPQRDARARRVRHGRADGAPDLFLIALAALELRQRGRRATRRCCCGRGRPLARPRRAPRSLAFVARRLEAEPRALLVAIRDGEGCPFDGAGVPRAARSTALDDDAAGALLDAHAPDLAPAVRERILARGGRQPARAGRAAARRRRRSATASSLPAWLPLTTRLEQAFADARPALPDADADAAARRRAQRRRRARARSLAAGAGSSPARR